MRVALIFTSGCLHLACRWPCLPPRISMRSLQQLPAAHLGTGPSRRESERTRAHRPAALAPLLGCSGSAPRQSVLSDGRPLCRQQRRPCSVVAAAAGVTDTAAAACGGSGKKLVFLGTPEVAAGVLQRLLTAAEAPGSGFEVAAVVTQPGRRRGRNRGPQPSPVAEAAAQRGVEDTRILTPASAKDEVFLDELRRIGPDLCVTAAYGNILPSAFLAIPARGTLNIHPSLLPRWRGAAPVPRALEAGDAETGVSVAFTVRAMDAGPVLAAERVAVDDTVQAPQLLQQLFERGTELLIERLPAVWSGEAAAMAVPQDALLVTHAPKMSKEEGILDFALPARQLHNKVRAFAGWPGTSATLWLQDVEGSQTAMDLKILETRVGSGSAPGGPEVLAADGALAISCGDGSVLEVMRVQLAGKKPVGVTDFLNGFVKGRQLLTSQTA